jgi:hypothetical protein
MMGRHCIFGACVMLAGCNLLSGAADLVTGEADPDSGAPVDHPPRPDGGTSPTSVVDGATDGLFGADTRSDAGIDAADAGPPRPNGGRFVFVTSTTSNGNLGGLAGADTRCNQLAQAAGLGGTWVAWLSTGAAGGGGVRAIDRVTSAGPWYLLDGQLAAAGKASLSSDQLAHGIDRNEKGAAVGVQGVWTGTRAGAAFFGQCGGWVATTPGMPGTIGITDGVDQSWSSSNPDPCNATHHLYCFEN